MNQRFRVTGREVSSGELIEIVLQAQSVDAAIEKARQRGIQVEGAAPETERQRTIPPPVPSSPAASVQGPGDEASQHPRPTEKRRRRYWLGLLIVAAAVCAPFAPKVTLWAGIIILALVVLAFIPKIQSISRWVFRLDPARRFRAGVKLILFALVALLLLVFSWSGSHLKAERERVAAQKAAQQAERQRLANEANGAVRSLVAEAKGNLQAGDVSLANKKLQAAMGVKHATDLQQARDLRSRIARATDPAAIRSIMVALSDEDFEQFQAGRAPQQLHFGFPVLDKKAEELAQAKIEEVKQVREQRRRERLAAERERQEREQAVAEAARKAEEQRKAQEQARKEDASRAQPADPEEEKEPELTLAQKRYLFYASSYLFLARKQGKTPPVLNLRNDESLVGRVEGNFRIVQIVGPSEFIADRLDSDDIPIYSVWVEGLSTSGQVDGAEVSFKDDTIFLHQGTKSYRTVLGAVRTIYSVKTLDDSLLGWAIGEVKKRDAELRRKRDLEHQRKVEVAKRKLAAIREEIKRFESEHARVAQYVSLRSKIAMYEPNAKVERVARLLEEAKKQLEALGKVSESAVQEYTKKRRELLERKREAWKELRSIGG